MTQEHNTMGSWNHQASLLSWISRLEDSLFVRRFHAERARGVKIELNVCVLSCHGNINGVCAAFLKKCAAAGEWGVLQPRVVYARSSGGSMLCCFDEVSGGFFLFPCHAWVGCAQQTQVDAASPSQDPKSNEPSSADRGRVVRRPLDLLLNQQEIAGVTMTNGPRACLQVSCAAYLQIIIYTESCGEKGARREISGSGSASLSPQQEPGSSCTRRIQFAHCATSGLVKTLLLETDTHKSSCCCAHQLSKTRVPTHTRTYSHTNKYTYSCEHTCVQSCNQHTYSSVHKPQTSQDCTNTHAGVAAVYEARNCCSNPP